MDGAHAVYTKELYRAQGQDWVKEKNKLWRKVMEEYTLHKELGDISGKGVLDLACGDGAVTRFAAARGAASVVGVDISTHMLNIARASTDSASKITYKEADCFDLESMKSALGETRFEVITASWFLVYAADLSQIERAAAVISHFLSPGGKCLGTHHWPASHKDWVDDPYLYWPFFIKREPQRTEDGFRIIYDVRDIDEPKKITMTFRVFDYPESSMKQCFSKQGLELNFSPLELDPNREDAREAVQKMIEKPVVAFFVATKKN